ncbi:RNA polymerase sigma factor [Terrihalobacillus insolitus]|uniref:RNA polymerase sigma factor n=1 Tax=Terrihalobacillus insolitus TaxID=2950438 RepID=UPI00233F8341|nr:RNA polymerase sigma factor [Terrihalobacillus insolitus]MDC3413161.1 RNA polymerase sigma factor [Terrihalobacillus insolitus]
MGDFSEVEYWFTQHGNDIYNFLVYFTDKQEVDDLMQETFIKAMTSRHTFQQQSHEKTWLISIARRVAIDNYRKKKIVNLPLTLYQALFVDDKSNPETTLLENERDRDLYNQVNTLPKNQRDIVILRGIMELSTRECSEVLSWSEAKVNTTYHRAKLVLRKQIQMKWEEAGSCHPKKKIK